MYVVSRCCATRPQCGARALGHSSKYCSDLMSSRGLSCVIPALLRHHHFLLCHPHPPVIPAPSFFIPALPFAIPAKAKNPCLRCHTHRCTKMDPRSAAGWDHGHMDRMGRRLSGMTSEVRIEKRQATLRSSHLHSRLSMRARVTRSPQRPVNHTGLEE